MVSAPRSRVARPPRALPRSGNRRVVLSALARAGSMSRADLARTTGLSRTTVSSVVARLVETGHVRETHDRGTPHKGGSGRPPQLVALATPPGAVVGVDIGHGHIQVAVADRSGSIRSEECARLDVDGHGPAALDQACAMVEALCSGETSPGQLVGVGMCVPAPIDRDSAQVGSHILRGWRDLAPAAELERRLGVPVVADNDANLGALAELHRGAASDVSDLVYVKLASGVGAGIVLGGRVHRGTTGIAGEIGHVPIREDGEVCRCGNRGCLETEVALPRLLQVLQPAYDRHLTIDALQELEVAGEAGVVQVLNDAGLTVGRALADLCNTLNPEVVVLGGSLGSSGAFLRGVRSSIDRYAQPNVAAAVTVRSGDLGERAEVVGAVTLAIGRLVVAEAG